MIKFLMCFILTMIMISTSHASEILHPKGIYSSHVGQDIDKYINEPYVQGALIRVRWSDLEKQEGVFDFSRIEQQRKPVIQANKKWSLAIVAGSNTPRWLQHKTKNKMHIRFRGQDKTIIPFWDKTYQSYALKLAKALAKKYGQDPNLVLVYIPQQTANGIEGHFNGTSFGKLTSQGLTKDNWMSAVKASITSYSKAFPDKALAIELHEILGQADIPNEIIDYIETKHKNQVGIAIWWLSGKWTYQSDLLDLLAETNSPIYAQVIGKSSQLRRFPNGKYTEIFKQAKEIGAHYIEVWNYELEKPVAPEIKKAIKEFSDTHHEK